jgi:hypothetical protein
MAHTYRLLANCQLASSRPYEVHYPSRYSLGVKAKIKNGFAPKTCEHCGRPFEWRKKWARDWENVKYCSEKCKSGK